ncbi:PD-(D/E)XK nuclease family protein [Algoriphagus sediminis]|uniref:PD-(D/E)XK nuclease family protein n=1 Tax=Algoriphagus sediminis TaxID=3057113 RepID=A0ABT7YHD1_9BACT|nr:PD-(D/E)XK nuclease family protein [Algoriphagus sediminis]MDN3205936.1 PD-(D/E)XK nuclease family protein [Algoriphagus sediminis]
MEHQELEQKYAQLLRDPEFDRLELLLKEPNIFKILGVEDYEIRHSNFLAWLLDPFESHGLNEGFLRRFLQDIFIDNRSQDFSLVELAGLDLSQIEVWREWKGIDILVYSDDIIISIENKVWSGEHSNQLKKYKDTVESQFPHQRKAYVFLSPYGVESSEDEFYVNYSYERINQIIENIIEIRRHQIGDSVLTYLADYSTIIKQNIMNSDHVNEMAKQLYQNHRELLDFVFKNKPNAWDDFRVELEGLVKEKGWILGSKNRYDVKFYPEGMADLIMHYKKANGWPDREAFGFQLNFYDGKRIAFSSYVTKPVQYFDYWERLTEILSEIPDANTKLGKEWKAHFKDSVKWPLEKNMENWNEKKADQVRAFLDKITPIVEKVEAKMLEHKDELLRLKEGIEQYD